MDLKKTWTVLFLLLSLVYATNLPPLFTNDMNNVAISEKTKVGTVIYKLSGHDPENSPVHYSIKGTDVLQVDPNTGDVTVVKPLDYETNDTLNLIVTIEDEVDRESGEKNNVVELPVSVIILDENDNHPQFEKDSYNISIVEDAQPGTTIYSEIHVTDKDTIGENIEVDCVALPEYLDACDIFSLKAVAAEQNIFHGEIVLKKKLSYAKQKFYQFLLKATDGELTNTTTVNINVEDVQDTPPYFIGNFSSEVDEDAPIGTLIMKIKAEDGDRGKPRPIVYELINNPLNYFLLNAHTGELKSAKPLDKEIIDNPEGKIVLTIRARELVNDKKSEDPLTIATTEATVIIKDVNDEPPMFDKKEYFVEIPENIQTGENLPLDMFVKDPDQGDNSVFSLELDDFSGAFSIEPATAKGETKVTIKVINSSLDYENPNQRKFIILAIAKEILTKEKLQSTATITITVIDVNDNYPTFDYPNYKAMISEMSPPGTIITTITAKDRDSGNFGENGIVYRLEGNGTDKFTIDRKSGTISVADCLAPGEAECLDYETQPEYNLEFIATDNNGKGLTTRVPLTITLTDSNDNAPVFQKELYEVLVDENSVKFNPDLIISAKDADQTSHVTYSLIPEDKRFGIDSSSGKIRIMDNEGLKLSEIMEENLIALNILATDGKYSTTTTLHIMIKDVNDNSPEFTKKIYVENVAEDVAIGYAVTTVQATDADTGLNSEIKYQISKGDYNDFTIDENSGTVTVKSKLDYDKRTTYNMEILAIDGGEPALTGTATLMVNIVDTNDKLPFFKPEKQAIEVMEDVPIGTKIYTLQAEDPDVNPLLGLKFDMNGPITAIDKFGNEAYDEAYKSFFKIDENSGDVIVATRLLRDIAAVINIPVIVRDLSAPRVQEATGLLTIEIKEVNTSPPSFLPPWIPENPYYQLDLKEEQPISTIIGMFKAIDVDSDIAFYTISPPSEYFEINNGTGIVQIKKVVDYEKIKQLNFTVYAFDSGIPQLNSSAIVLINLININDNDPIFTEKIYNATLTENSQNGTVVVVVNATDLDEGEFGEVTYELHGDYSNYFEIDPKQGVITVADNSLLDYERVQNVTLKVTARDGAPKNLARTSTAKIFINIMDLNDNKPIFNQTSYNVTIMEDVRLNPPQSLVQVYATDKDNGINGNIHYSIIGGNDNDTFLIGLETGILYPHKSLIGQSRKFSLRVQARDGAGLGRLADETTINVDVLNINKHKPIFINPADANTTIELVENNSEEDYLVLIVKALDEDEGENGRITYHLKNGSNNVQETEYFTIDINTGELRIKRQINEYKKSDYEISVVARDHGIPLWHESIRNITISMVDLSRHGPEFSLSDLSNPYRFFITENNPENMHVGRVKATDKIKPRLAKIYYYIIMESEKGAFQIDKTDGSIYAKRSFDREERDQYNLLILASNQPDFYVPEDQFNETLQGLNKRSICEVVIMINDVNDNPPIFEKENYYAGVRMMANINELITGIKAIDLDQGQNGTVSYMIKSSNLYKDGSNVTTGSILPSPFNVSQDGEIYTATYLSENNQHRFILDVIAREIVFPERETYTKVHIWVFEPEQLIRMILSRPPKEVAIEQEAIVNELGNITKCLVIVHELKHHVDDQGKINDDWTDMYILTVNPETQEVKPVAEFLKTIDSRYDYLKDYYLGYAIANVVPAFITEQEETFNATLAAITALIIILLAGILTFCVICCCLRNWIFSSSDMKKKDTLISKAIIDDLNTTENPLWIEQKLKIYEEQELTMQVFNEPDPNLAALRDNDEYTPVENTYATIQYPNRRSNSHMTMSLADGMADYATLSNVPHHGSSSSSLRGAPNYFEAAMGFNGSTFQVPERLIDSSNDLTQLQGESL